MTISDAAVEAAARYMGVRNIVARLALQAALPHLVADRDASYRAAALEGQEHVRRLLDIIATRDAEIQRLHRCLNDATKLKDAVADRDAEIAELSAEIEKLENRGFVFVRKMREKEEEVARLTNGLKFVHTALEQAIPLANAQEAEIATLRAQVSQMATDALSADGQHQSLERRSPIELMESDGSKVDFAPCPLVPGKALRRAPPAPERHWFDRIADNPDGVETPLEIIPSAGARRRVVRRGTPPPASERPCDTLLPRKLRETERPCDTEAEG